MGDVGIVALFSGSRRHAERTRRAKDNEASNSGYQRPALRERSDSSGPSAGTYPDRHLGSLSAAARPRGDLRLCRRYARHRDHAAGRVPGGGARSADRIHAPGARERLRGFSDRPRQLLFHPLRREPSLLRADLQSAQGPRADLYPRRSSSSTIRKRNCFWPTAS